MNIPRDVIILAAAVNMSTVELTAQQDYKLLS